MQAGVYGLLRDKTRPSRKPPLDKTVIARVVELTAGDPPGEATHWTAAAMAKATGISLSSVQRIGAAMVSRRTGSASSSSPTIRSLPTS